MIKSDKDIVFFDLKATSQKITSAHIIDFAAVKVEAKNGKIIDHFEANEIIIFSDIAGDIARFIQDCDLCGFNLTRFDLPLLAEEFARIDVNCPQEGTRIIDTQVIYHTANKRDLSAALTHYCNEDHFNNNAMDDVLANVKILTKQLQVENIIADPVSLHEFSMRGKGMADWSRLFYYDNQGELRYNFGKNRDKLVSENEEFARWMINKEFPQNSINFISAALDEFTYSKEIGF